MEEIAKRIAQLAPAVREQSPLVHCITNYVTVNDVANGLLAIGASPIMSDDLDDVDDIARLASAVDLNIGTLNHRTVTSMRHAGKVANAEDIPVILDPVGAGASRMRNEAVSRLLEEVQFAVIRGNASELGFIAGLEVSTKGVDASEEDISRDVVSLARDVAWKYNTTVALTGPVDVITNGTETVRIMNGHPMLKSVTGTGCVTTALVGAWVAAARSSVLRAEEADLMAAAAGAVSMMGIAGEKAFAEAGEKCTGSFHMALIDALSTITADDFMQMGRYGQEQL